MRVADIPTPALLVTGLATGLVGGFVAAKLADALPPRYEITHLVTGPARTKRNVALVILTTVIGAWLGYAISTFGQAPLDRAIASWGTSLVLSVFVLAAAAVDIEHMILPNELTLGGAALALATAHFRGLGLVGAGIGVAVGLALTYLPFLLYKKLRGRSGMGLGDAKLALLAGAWLGFEGAMFVVFAGALQSALAAGIMKIAGVTFTVPESVKAEIADLRAKAAAGDAEAKELLADDPMAGHGGDGGDGDDGGNDEASDVGDPLLQMRLPMGPFLVLACLEFLVARRVILELFIRFF